MADWPGLTHSRPIPPPSPPRVIVALKGTEGSDSDRTGIARGAPPSQLEETAKERSTRAPSSPFIKGKFSRRTNRSRAMPARPSSPEPALENPPSLLHPTPTLSTGQELDEPLFLSIFRGTQPTRDKHAKLRGSERIGLQPNTGIIPGNPSPPKAAPPPAVPMRLARVPSAASSRGLSR